MKKYFAEMIGTMVLVLMGCGSAVFAGTLQPFSSVGTLGVAFAFGLSAEIERNLISQRTKEALSRVRAEGKILGRPKGRKSSKVKLTGKNKIILDMLAKGHSKSAIARKLKVHRITLSNYIERECLN